MDTIRAYYKLTKPGIIRGNLLTAAAGFVVATGRSVDFGLLAATLVGITLVIGSACVVNNYFDREIDRVMDRTKERALATGTIPIQSAWIYAALLAVAGFSILAWWTNWLTVIIGAVGYFDYVVLYGLAKRRSWHGTLIGSISGSTPVVAGYTAVSGRFDDAALILFLILTFWQMPHFYAIALRRLNDYKAAKLPVLPAVRGLRATKSQIVVYMAAFVMAVLALGLRGYTGTFYLITMGALSLGWIVVGLNGWRQTDSQRWATQVFLYSLMLLPAFLVIVLVDALLAG